MQGLKLARGMMRAKQSKNRINSMGFKVESVRINDVYTIDSWKLGKVIKGEKK